MRTTRNGFLAVLAALTLGLGLAIHSFAADDTTPQVGQKAPTFSLPSQDGSTISLSSFHGKWVVLYFYPKDMTKGCTIEAHNFQQDLDQYSKLNAVIVGVSVDTTGSHQEFCAQQGLQFKLLSDQDKKVSAMYGSLGPVVAKRNTFLIDPHGKIVKVWTGVDPNVHSQEVLAALNTLEKKG